MPFWLKYLQNFISKLAVFVRNSQSTIYSETCRLLTWPHSRQTAGSSVFPDFFLPPFVVLQEIYIDIYHPRGQPPKVGSKHRRRPNIMTPRCVCSTEGCGTYLNEFDRHLKCVSCLSTRHCTESQTGNPCSPCQSLASCRCRKKWRTRRQVL